MKYTKVKDSDISLSNVQNYYGGVVVREEDSKYWWGIVSHSNDINMEEIPKSLYDELLKFKNG